MENTPKKIAVIGYSGAGKSTLASALGKKYGLDVLHIDCIQFLPGWAVRPADEKQALMTEFLNAHDASGWVIDGNYTKLSYERRLSEADAVFFLNFNRAACLFRAMKRNRQYKGRVRDSIAPGCPEKMDAAFVRWILWEGRSKEIRSRFRKVCTDYPDKVTVIRNQRALDRCFRAHGLEP